MARKKKRSHMKDVQKDAKSDMTPMIDAVFLLIIFFLCIDFKTLEAKLPAYLPKDRGSQPTPEEPVTQLSIRVVNTEWGKEIVRKANTPQFDKKTGKKNAFRLEGHVCYWEVGPKRFDDMALLKKELTSIAEDPRQRVPDKENPGQTKIMSVVIEPQDGVTYGDVATLVDVVRAAKFEEINFGGGRGAKK